MTDRHDWLSRIGVFEQTWGTQPPAPKELVSGAVLAEELGFDSISLGTHYTIPNTPVYAGFGNRYNVDPLVIAPLLGAATSRIRIGLNAALLPALHPYQWAQWFSTLDVATTGRVIAGLAIGWWDEDLRVGQYSAHERGARTDEALDVVTRLWRGETIEGPGRFWDTAGLRLDPLPVQQPLPVWVGGASPAAFARAARHGQSVLVQGQVTPDLRASLDAAAAATGRSPRLAQINFLAITNDLAECRDRILPIARLFARANDPYELFIIGTPERAAHRIRALFASGIDYLALDSSFFGNLPLTDSHLQWRRLIEDVLPLLD